MGASDDPQRAPLPIRILRSVLRALLFAFVVGFGIGTWLRCTAERSMPRELPYLGERSVASDSDRPA